MINNNHKPSNLLFRNNTKYRTFVNYRPQPYRQNSISVLQCLENYDDSTNRSSTIQWIVEYFLESFYHSKEQMSAIKHDHTDCLCLCQQSVCKDKPLSQMLITPANLASIFSTKLDYIGVAICSMNCCSPMCLLVLDTLKMMGQTYIDKFIKRVLEGHVCSAARFRNSAKFLSEQSSRFYCLQELISTMPDKQILSIVSHENGSKFMQSVMKTSELVTTRSVQLVVSHWNDLVSSSFGTQFITVATARSGSGDKTAILQIQEAVLTDFNKILISKYHKRVILSLIILLQGYKADIVWTQFVSLLSMAKILEDRLLTMIFLKILKHSGEVVLLEILAKLNSEQASLYSSNFSKLLHREAHEEVGHSSSKLYFQILDIICRIRTARDSNMYRKCIHKIDLRVNCRLTTTNFNL